MAVDPSRTKRNIDFDTYVAPKEGSRVDWGKQAKVISDAFSNVATDRQRRKDEIDADTKSNIDKLNELDQMDNKTLMDMTIDGSNGAANAIYEAEQKMKRGELRPQDFQKLKQNISSGFTQFQKNAKSWDTDFQRYTERMQSGESSSLEQYLGERMESFGNLKNLQLVTNPDTGNLAFGRIDEDGNLLTGPDDLISLNRMTAISKQEINKVNVGEFVKSSVEELGTYILAGNATTMGVDGSSRAVVTIEDFMQTEDADNYITDKANEILNSQGAFSVGSILADSGVKNKYKEAFRGGDQEEFDKWLKDNPNAEPSENPIIVMGYKENGVVVEPAITEGQETIARDYIKRSIRGALDRKETMKESSFQPQQPNPASIAKGDKDKRIDASGQSVNLLVTGDATAAEAAAADLISSSEKIEDIERVVDDNNVVTSFKVKVKGKVSKNIDVKDKKGKLKTTDELNREIYKLVEAEGTYDEWKERNDVGKNIGEGGAQSTVAADEIKYTLPVNVVILDPISKKSQTYDEFFDSESGGNLGSELVEYGFSSDGEADVQVGFTNLLESANFIPKGLKDFYAKNGGEIKVQVGKAGGIEDDKMLITIGEEEVEYADVFADGKTGGTAGIAQAVREAIQREIQRANTGKSQFDSGNKDKKLTKTEWMEANPGKTAADYVAYFNA